MHFWVMFKRTERSYENDAFVDVRHGARSP